VTTAPLNEYSKEAFFYFVNISSLYKVNRNVRQYDFSMLVAASLDFEMITILDWKTDWGYYPPEWHTR
jgi:hypothetical protein